MHDIPLLQSFQLDPVICYLKQMKFLVLSVAELSGKTSPSIFGLVLLLQVSIPCPSLGLANCHPRA